MDEETQLLGCLGVITLYIVTTVISTLLNGWALAKLWVWFITPTFGLVPLTVIQAIGFGVVISFLTAKYQEQTETKEKSSWQRYAEAVAYSLIHPLFFVGIGSIVARFM